MAETAGSLRAMQKELDEYVQQFEAGYFSPLAQLACLTEEVGELAREINHQYGEKSKKADEVSKALAEELGDVLTVTLMMANALELDLTEVFAQNMMKFKQRDKFRFARKDGKKHD